MNSSKEVIRTSYAQNREDIILSAYFHEIEEGFYIDVGANHPVIDSVTNLFYEQGWSGINVEPLPAMYAELERLRIRDNNVRAIVGEKKGSATLHIYHTPGEFNGLSTASKNQEKVIDNSKRNDIESKEDIKVDVLTLKDIISNRVAKNQKIQFLKIDVEGLEYEVLKSNDWNIYRPEIICIEADHIFNDWRKYIESKGYRLDFFDGVNEYYVEVTSKRNLADVYVDQILKKTHVSLYARMYFQEQQQLIEEKYRNDQESLLKNIRHLQKKIEIQEKQISTLEFEIKKRKNLLIYLVSSINNLSIKIEHNIYKLNKPKWNYPSLDLIDYKQDADKLIAVAHQTDLVFSTEPRVPVHRRIAYILLIVPFRIIRKITRVAYRIMLKIYRKTRKDTI